MMDRTLYDVGEIEEILQKRYDAQDNRHKREKEEVAKAVAGKQPMGNHREWMANASIRRDEVLWISSRFSGVYIDQHKPMETDETELRKPRKFSEGG